MAIVKYDTSSTSPPIHSAVVTPSDTTDIPGVASFGATRGLSVGVAGDVAVVMSGGETTVVPMVAGQWSMSVTRVKETGTTATGIVAWW